MPLVEQEAWRQVLVCQHSCSALDLQACSRSAKRYVDFLRHRLTIEGAASNNAGLIHDLQLAFTPFATVELVASAVGREDARTSALRDNFVCCFGRGDTSQWPPAPCIVAYMAMTRASPRRTDSSRNQVQKHHE